MGTRIENSVHVKCNPEKAWEIYCDWKRWRMWNNTYGDIRWVEGMPWVPGSRLEIDIIHPRSMTARQVLTLCEEPRRVAWVGHGAGVTYEQWVNFSPNRGGGTLVFVWIELTGIATEFFGKTVGETARDLLTDWFEAFRAECDLGIVPEGQRSTSPPP